MNRSIRAALPALALSASAASAQPFLEFSVNAHAEDISTGTGNVIMSAQFTVDASDPTQTPIPSTVRLISHDPASPAPPEPDAAATVNSFFVSTGGTFYAEVEAPYGVDTHSLTINFNLDGPVPDPDISIPDDPAAYTGWFINDVHMDNGTTSAFARWRESEGFSFGLYTFAVREVPDPTPPEPNGCSEADLAEPFGVLNFDDVLAYLTAFGAGCP